MSGPRGIESETSEKALLEEPTRGIESDGEVDKEGRGCGGDESGGRRGKDATGWKSALALSRGSRKAVLHEAARGEEGVEDGREWAKAYLSNELLEGRVRKEEVCCRVLRAMAIGDTSLERPLQSMVGSAGGVTGRKWEGDQRRRWRELLKGLYVRATLGRGRRESDRKATGPRRGVVDHVGQI